MLWILTAVAAEPIALVELFTSQGCSSCPPADALLHSIDREARESERPVYVVSYHVDYWDRLGWKDPYSDSRWTGRQKEYADAFRLTKLYTPQVVVNGTMQGIGSSGPRVKGYIAHALTESADAKVEGRATVEGRTVKIEVTATGAPIGGQIYVAVIEPERRNPIPTGENKGSQGVYTNVVRAMVKTKAPGSRGSIPVPEDVDLDRIEVIAWVSDPLTLEVVGASKLTR